MVAKRRRHGGLTTVRVTAAAAVAAAFLAGGALARRAAARDGALSPGATRGGWCRAAEGTDEQRSGRAPRPARLGPPSDASLLEGALARLRALGFRGPAQAIERRVAQHRPKMKLTADQGLAAASALVAIAHLEPVRAMQAVLPRSTVELARAIDERELPVSDASAIARYLVRLVAGLAFERLDAFDESHSHVIGRRWHEIDYQGEGMTWQRQRAHWARRGVADFRSVGSIHAYFRGAEPMRHWQRVYRPRRRIAEVAGLCEGGPGSPPHCQR